MISTHTKKLFWGFTILYAILLLVVLFTSGIMYYRVAVDITDKSAWDSLYIQKGAHLQVEFIHNYKKGKEDNTQTTITPIDQRRIDSVFQIVKENQEVIVRKQDEMIESFRQEANNNIDKLNLWLTFWIGVISFFGVAFPIVSQIFLYRSYKDDLSDLERKSKVQRFTSLVNSLHIGIDNRLLTENTNRDCFLQKTWTKIVDIMEEVVSDCMNKETITTKDVEEVTLCLFYVRSFLQRRQLLRNNRRQADKLSLELSNMTQTLIDENDISQESYKKLRTIIARLRYLFS